MRCVLCARNTERDVCCWRCLDRVKARLRELGSLVRLLRQSPTLCAQQMTAQEGRGSGSPGSVINLEIVDLISRHGIQAVVLEWCSYISETRRLTEIKRPSNGTGGARKSLWDTSMAFLETHLEWLSQQEDVWTDFVYEITTPWAKLRQIVYGERRPPSPVPCPVLDCTGTIRLHPNGDAACRHDESHYWPYENWASLALLIAEETYTS